MANETNTVQAPEHLITPATVMTASRPVMAAEVGRKLIKGEIGVTPLFMTMASTDLEGKMAGLIDKVAPGKGIGRTEFGKEVDPIADSIAFGEVGLATLFSPRASRLGKAAAGIVLTTEGVKGKWAAEANSKHKKETGERLVIAPSMTGKLATTAKFLALTSAVRTHDLEPGARRTAYGIAAVTAAGVGTILGEKARRGYDRALKKSSK